MTQDAFHITLPQTYTRLYDEDVFLRDLKPVGVTRRGFRALCSALGVPMLHIGNKRLLDAFTFSIAMRAALRLGEPDFLAPGCRTIAKAERQPVYAGEEHPSTTRKLDLEKVAADYEKFLLEILSTQTLAETTTKPALSKAVRDYVNSLPLEKIRESALADLQRRRAEDPRTPVKEAATA